MALIVVHHTIADNFDVDPTYTVGTDGRILQGMLVGLNTSGYVARAGNGGSGANLIAPLGIAGDSISDEYQTNAYSAELVIGGGRKVGSDYVAPMRWTSNRVSDFYNETLSSSKMTVYVGSGRFATDQYDPGKTYARGEALYAADATNSAIRGRFTNVNAGSSRPVGYVVATPTDYPSGVPGVDSPTVDNSMSLGSFLTVHLSI